MAGLHSLSSIPTDGENIVDQTMTMTLDTELKKYLAWKNKDPIALLRENLVGTIHDFANKEKQT